MPSFNDIWIKIQSLPVFSRMLQRPTLFKIATNTGWLILDKGIKILVGLVVGAWITRYLGPDRFGVFSYARAFVALFAPIAGLGLANIAVRNLVNQPHKKDDLLGTVFILQLLASTMAFGLAIITTLISRPDNVEIQILISILSGLLIFQAWSNTLAYWFQSKIQSKFIVWSRVISIILLSLIRIALILSQAPLVSFAWAILFESVLLGLLMTYFYLRMEGKLFKLKISISHAKALLKDSWPLIIAGMAVIIYMKIDQIMLGNMTSDVKLGLYSAAVQLSELWYFLPVAISTSFFPTIISSRKNLTNNEYRARMQLFFDLMAGVAYLVTLATILVAPLIITVLYGAAFSEAGVILRVHIWAFIFVSLGVASSQWLLAENMVKFSMMSTIIGSIVNIGLNIWLIPRYAGMGAAWATVISYAVAAFFLTMLIPKTRDLFYQLSLSLLMPFRILSIWKSFRKYILKV